MRKWNHRLYMGIKWSQDSQLIGGGLIAWNNSREHQLIILELQKPPSTLFAMGTVVPTDLLHSNSELHLQTNTLSLSYHPSSGHIPPPSKAFFLFYVST